MSNTSTHSIQKAPWPADAKVVMACDQQYAMPLATALRSLADNNPAAWPIEVTVLTTHFPTPQRRTVEQSLRSGSVLLTWKVVDLSAFENVTLLDHISVLTLARLFIPSLVPVDTKRVVYLDADILVLGDISHLFHVPLGDAAIGAVADEDLNRRIQTGSTDLPFGLPRVRQYFNAGVLVFDLKACREREIFGRALAHIRSNPRTPYADQDALNAACDDDWRSLEPRWNFQGHLRTRIERLPVQQQPSIAHFISSSKPWMPRELNWNTKLYNRYRKRTLYCQSPGESIAIAAARLDQRIRNRTTRLQKRLVSALKYMVRLVGSH